ncbi:PREDICTED: E3 ubiquitin-protein ligase RNF213-like [Amphimedon queenslandica]|uniref:AAA+ ATPase domain-containing protein n=2 Tax=Amphimedon queenslandica TaxID=400682 RepID=A0AAN0JBS4_AMPQE|nr:PREDICTED: E3 ubiquitin-protein ligase RNF213-like [Amphimedon queenslandica]|eukprot:XP_019854153.1 PREDICTED: E3 ubiquitin-protein ligase RNF213-like [Amphimedon queenslandica]
MDSANNRIILFQFHQALLVNFISYLDKELNKELKVCKISPAIIDDMHINELCVEDGEKLWKYPFLEAADPVKPLLIPCAVMTSEKYKNDIFHQQCKDQVKCLNNTDTWPQIAVAVEAAFESCTLIVAKLRDQSITLHEIDTLFRSASSAGVVAHTLSQLESALLFSRDTVNFLKSALTFSNQKPPCSVSSIFITPETESLSPWINEVATNVYLWRGLSPLLIEAQDFADILNDLEVEPAEFIAFSNLSLHTTKLKSVASEKEILEFMRKTKELTGEIKDSIRMFAKSKKLREWILAKSEDLNAMETFIGVVLDTLAEEGDEIQDRLTNLSELCSKFSLLIYNFDESKSKIKCLIKLFEDTYKKLSDLSGAISLVEICNNDFEWYKRIGELQGSIEQGAVTQMREINQHGSYSIQSSGDSHKCRVSLSIVQDKKHIVSLDDLNELESKLVLITRKHSSWAEEKELFQEMLKRIILISESVQKLKDFGHLEYLDWEKKYHCPEYVWNLKSLDQEISTLENTLISWMYNVWNCRYEFPELNYYTTEQLIVFRKELTLIKNDPSKEVNPQVFYLLHSVVGEPVDSTMLLKKGLKYDEKFSIVHEDNEEDSSSIEVAQPVDFLLSVDDAVSLNASEVESISVLQEAMNSLNEKKREIYHELVNCGYQNYKSVEAATLHDDIYNAMDWCDELEDKEEETLRNKYFPAQTTATSTNSLSFSQDCSLTVSEQNPIKISVMPDFVHFDVTPIVSMFVSSDIHFTPNLLMDDKKMMMSLNDLGDFLKTITKLRGRKQIKRSFPEQFFEKGQPNLVVAPADEIFNCVIQIYAEDEDAPLPCYEEILLCSSNTTLEQVVVFWMRTLFDQYPGRIYCLVHAEKLGYLVSDKAIDLLLYLSQGITDYRLVIVCSNESEGKSHVITRLNSYHRNWKKNDDLNILKKYLKKHFIPKTNDKNINASIIDDEESLVRIIYSKQAAAGKSLHIRKMKDRLNAVLKEKDLLISKKKPKVMLSIPLHGPDVTPDEVLKMLLAEKNVVKSCIIHIDVPQQVLHSIDDILFSIIILQGLSDSRGQIWRCRSTHFYAIEMTIPSETSYIRKFTEARRALSLLYLVPNKECYQPLKMMRKIGKGDLTDLRTPMYQRVYKYLKLFDSKKYQELEKFQYIGTLEDTNEQCLETIIKHCGTTNPTWKEIRHFVWFLNHQLSACEQSNVIKTVKGLKTFTVKFMIDMSRDFATSSMPNEEGSEDIINQHNPRQNWEHSLHPYLFFNKNRKSVTHVGLALNGLEVVEDKSQFHQHKFTMQISPEVERFLSLKVNVPKISQQKIGNVLQRSSNEGYMLLKRLVNFMNIPIEDGIEIISPDENYVLTQDNLTKIMGIQTRFRCQIPVVLMGETGCGKTHLIRFMCKVAAYDKNIKNMFIIKIHGGTTEDDVIKCLEEAEFEALKKNRKEKVDTVVFFDEANTSDVISLIKEIMCDGKCRGKPVPPFLKFVAACNPYRRHSEAMIKQLKGAGLGWRDKEPSRATEKLGEIPLRDLVYRVLKIPDSLKALVYDFGKLDSNTERDYIYQIVHSRLKEEIYEKEVLHAIAHVLAECQKYLKNNQDECSFVSLRDVERAMIFFRFFYNKFIVSFPTQRITSKTTDSLLLALTVSYFARLDSQDVDDAARTKFEDCIFKTICNSKELKCLSVHHAHTCNFRPILSGYQNKLLDCMSIEENIARNAALRENLFMMFVCIQLRIPLFLVGKPGSSKSLAKTIIQNSMRGQNSKNKTLKQFNHVHIHSYQCSELSTAGSIREVFYSAVKYQEKRRKNDSSFVSVVVLDEVGLAEASPYLPLKSLHPLLEDGTEGTGSTDTRVKREDRVAFVGISNWALDPAKMNRGILVRRSEPSINDLIDSAKGICSDKDAQTRLAHYFDNLARAYHEIFKNQPTEFFGLRDYYSLIKMLHWMTKSTGTILTVPQLRHAIKRNFSGFTATKDFDPYKCFLNKLPELENVQGASNLMKRLHNKAVVLLKGEKSKLFLATACNTTLEFTEERNVQSHFVIYCESQSGKKKLFTFQSLYFPDYFIAEYRGKLTLKKGRCYFSVKEVKSHGIQLISMTSSKPAEIEDEANFFPIHPENSPANPDCSPRGLIRESLINRDTSKHGESRYLLFLTDNYSSLQILKHYIMSSYSKSSASQYEPFVLFGSSFPKDRDFAQVCRNISEIRLCMETGRMIILLNLENLYESLYDLLNQYYIKSGRHRYVDLGLRTHRMKCSVHEDFKLILIAEKKKVYDDFPTPLVNRLEKHFINNETVLEDWQKTVVDDIEKWLKSFMTDNDGFKIKDAFVGYNSDTKAAVVLQATTQFQMSKNILEKEKMVLQLSKKLLLQMATPDAVVRALKKDTEEGRMFLKQVYFNEQEHSSLVGLLQRISWHDENTFLLQVTSHSLPMYQKEIHSLKESLRIDDTQLERAHLEAFETEYEFLASVDGAIDKGKMKPFYQIYECEFGQDNGNLISCCRYRLVDKIKELTKGKSVTLFVLIVHLPRKCDNTDFVSFQEYPWVCYHVDELIPSKESKALLRQIVCQSNHLSHLFLAEGTDSTADKLFNTVNDPNQYLQLFPLDEAEPVNLCSRVHTYITDAVSQLDQSEKIQSSQKIKKLESLISKNAQRSQIFYSVTIALMKRVLEGMDDSQWWVFEEAISIQHLQEGGSFSNVLIRRFDKTLKPLFIQIIRFIDRHSNLQLLMPDCLDENDKPLSKLWLNIYSSWELCQSTLFKVVASQKYEKIDQKVFQCSFPFSWIIYEYINKKIDDDNEDILQDFELQECFKSLPPALFKEFAAFYSHDFVFLLRSSDATHCELLSKALLTMSYATRSINDESNFIEILSEIHFTYSNFEEYFECFLDLAVEMPSIVRAITDKNETISDISSLIVVALQEVLNNIHLDEKVPLKGTAALRGWMQKMYQLQAIIDNIFNNLHLDNCHELKKQWQRLCVMKLFMEHVVVDHENELLKFATRLDRYSDKIEDYRGPQVLKSVSTLLIAVEDVVMKEIDKTDQISIKESCWNFFVDVLLNFCDSDNKEVLEILVDSVFSNASEIPKLHTYIQRHPEKLPFLHSFTIKLILSEDLFMATDHLLKIKDCIAASVSGQTKISMNSFFALVIAYLKMKTHKEGSLEMSEIVYCTDTLLGSSCEILLSASSNGEMTSPECLLAIAQLMYSCQLLAKTVADEDYRSLNSTADVDYFYNKADPVFQKPELNDDADKSGPLFFLIRFVVRRYGISVLTKLMELQYQQFSWVLSSNMDIDDSLKERQFVNYGAIYQPQYQKFYEAISEATTVTGDFKALEKISNSATSVSNLVPLIMALQYRMQLSYVSSTPSNRLSPDKIKALHNFIKQCKHFNSYREISKCIEEIVIKNCRIIPAIKVLKEDSFRTIIFRTLLIHSVLTVQANRQSPLISVLHSLLTSPDTLQGCMLPGMPSSTNTGTASIEVPLFPECTKGHKFPSTMVDISCPECGNIIQSPQPAYPQFIPSATGYVPVAVGCETPPFGYLNGISYSIIRCIIHCILLWATHDGKNVGQILNGKIDDPESYFWIQIEIDINDLSKAFSCSVEEASFVIHFVLKKINEKCLQVGILPNVVRSITQLRSIADREQWEELFHQFFITPVLENFEVHLLESISKMHSDTDYSALFDSAYMAHRNADPFLWQVYPEPTLEYLRHGLITFQRKDTNPVLFTLITESSCINATVCISDIIALQRKLSQNKVDEEKTFEDFVQLLDDIEKENYEALVKSLTMAWSSCRHCLMNNYDRLNTTEALKVEEIAADIPMKYLIPTTSGPGVLSTALVDHLVIVHNSFIKLCRDFVENNLNKRWMWEAHKVSLREMDSSLHAVNCNTEKLRELVTTHSVFIANPSGTIGIQYMLDNLEKDIVQQYVLGKPFIIDTLNIPTVENVVKLRQVIALITKNIEQSPLPLKVKSDFRSDLKTVQVIVGTCEVLEVAMKFLSKQTAPKTMKLSEYIEVDLLMKERIRSKKIMEYCNLEHVIGLWRFLQVECARVKNRHKINPFEHVRKQFRNTLKSDARAALEKAAHKVSDLDYLLEMLFEFIHTYVQYCDVNDSQKPLHQIFEDFLKQTKSKIISDLNKIFPHKVLLSQVTDCWKFLADFEDSIKKLKSY